MTVRLDNLADLFQPWWVYDSLPWNWKYFLLYDVCVPKSSWSSEVWLQGCTLSRDDKHLITNLNLVYIVRCDTRTSLTNSSLFLCVMCYVCGWTSCFPFSVYSSQQNRTGSKSHLPFLHNTLKVMQAIAALFTVRLRLLRPSPRMKKVHMNYNVL